MPCSPDLPEGRSLGQCLSFALLLLGKLEWFGLADRVSGLLVYLLCISAQIPTVNAFGFLLSLVVRVTPSYLK